MTVNELIKQLQAHDGSFEVQAGGNAIDSITALIWTEEERSANGKKLKNTVILNS